MNRALVVIVMNQLDRNFPIITGLSSNMHTRGKGRVAKCVQPIGWSSEGSCMLVVGIALVCYYSVVNKNVIRTNSTKIAGNVGIKAGGSITSRRKNFPDEQIFGAFVVQLSSFH